MAAHNELGKEGELLAANHLQSEGMSSDTGTGGADTRNWTSWPKKTARWSSWK